MIPDWISKIKILGWDLDGTLYPSDSRIEHLIKQKQLEVVAANLNIEIKEAEIKYKNLLAEIGSNTKTLNTLGIDGTKFFLDFWDQIDLKEYISNDPQIQQMFKELSNKKHFIISNSNRIDQIERKLKLVGIDSSIFDLIVDTVKIGKMKPDPDSFHQAIAFFGVKPEEILYIGDRDETDIKGAKAVGMKTCYVWGKSPLADLSINTPYELVKIIN